MNRGRGWMDSDYAIHEQIDEWSHTTYAIREEFKRGLRNNVYCLRNRDAAAQSMMRFNEQLYAYTSQVRSRYGAGVQQELQQMTEQYERQLAELRRNLIDERKGKEDALTRVSEMAAGLMKSGNAEITELSDPHRPMKLAEEFNASYDDDWTDVFEYFTEVLKKSDEEAIDLLFSILKKCHDYTQEIANTQAARILEICRNPTGTAEKSPASGPAPLQKKQSKKQELPSKGSVAKGSSAVEDELQPPSSSLEASVRDFMKISSSESVDTIVSGATKLFTNDKAFPPDVMSNPDVTKYYRKVTKLCWLMQTQYPPMHIMVDIPPGSPFNVDTFKEYRHRGAKIARIVWPPVALHKGGPLVSKGTAEGDKGGKK